MKREGARRALRRLGRLERDGEGLLAIVRDRVCAAYEERARRMRSPDALARLLEETAERELSGTSEETGRDRRARDEAWFRELARAARPADEDARRALLRATVERFLEDMAARFSARLYRAGAALVRAGLGVAFSPLGEGLSALQSLDARLRVAGPLERLRDLAREHTLVFAPTHSSNLDSPILGLALIRAGLPPVLYAAGKHLFRNATLGAFLRRVGAYRIDRGRHSALYGHVLAEYSTVLLERGIHTAIFPGGTRCRSNEVESAIKLGLLRTAIRADRARAGRRVYVVPTTINYQVVLEAETLVRYHVAGRGAERIRGDELFAWGRLRASAARLLRLDQAVVVRFADPLDPSEPSPPLGERITAAFRRETVFFATHLAARALQDLASSKPGATALARTEVHAAIRRLLETIRATPGSGSIHPDLGRASPDAILGRAVRAWRAAHTAEVVTLSGDAVVLRDTALLAFYRNRTSHLAPT